MKNQVLSIEQMLKLKELGVDTSKASMAFIKLPNTDKFEEDPVSNSERIFEYIVAMKYIPTFTLQDILEILPKRITVCFKIYDLSILLFETECIIAYLRMGGSAKRVREHNILQSAYNMLVWCAENGYLKGGAQ